MAMSFRRTVKVQKILRDIDKMLALKAIQSVHVARADYKTLLQALHMPLYEGRATQTQRDRLRKGIPYRGITIRPMGS